MLEELGLRPSGGRLDCRGDTAVGLSLPNGWYLVELKRWQSVPDGAAERLSAGAEVVVAEVLENPMVAIAEHWEAGTRRWRLQHVGTDGPVDDLDPEGEPPASFPTLREAARGKQAAEEGVDHFFDVPLLLAESIAGYKHDRFDANALGPEPYEELISVDGPRRRFRDLFRRAKR